VIRLVLNADDFGLTPGVNRSILELHRAGALTSATLMANAEHTNEAVAGAVGHQDLGVGCHVVLVDGKPVLPRDKIPRLTQGSGEFRPGLGAFVRDLLGENIPEAEIEQESIAQIRRIQAAGVRVTHVDTHKHTHIFPRVLRPLLRAAILCGVRAMRNPFEPDWALRATPGAPGMRRMQLRLLGTQRREFLKLIKQAGLATTDGAIGVLATGTLNAETLKALLRAMPDGAWELVCHPGYFDDDLKDVRTSLRESRGVEHSALLEVVPKFLREHPEVRAVSFGKL
jgi:chitin disaccharide deacetylase